LALPGITRRCRPSGLKREGGGVTVADESAGGTFRTFPAPGKAEPFTFAVYGDSRSAPPKHKQIALAIASSRPAFVLHTGDLASDDSLKALRAEFFTPASGLLGNVAACIVRGSHEKSCEPLDRLMGWPARQRWYSFDYANAHFVALDSLARPQQRQAMLQWVQADLAASKATWKVVFLHEGCYDLGEHLSHWGSTDFAPVFRAHGVDLVLAGHSHGYQRFRPMFTAGVNELRPITHIVTAGGGTPLKRIQASDSLAAARSALHFMLFDIDGGMLTGRALTATGEQIDHFRFVKDTDGRTAAESLAGAIPEEQFDTLCRPLAKALGEVALAPPAEPGEPYTATLVIGGGDHGLAYNLTLGADGGRYQFKSVQGSVKAGQTAEVSIAVKSSTPVSTTPDGCLIPTAWLQCDYRIGGEAGRLYTAGLRLTGATTQPDGPVVRREPPVLPKMP